MIRAFCLFLVFLLSVADSCWFSYSKDPLDIVLKVDKTSLGNCTFIKTHFYIK